jgi:hypothetical protein
MKNEKHCLLNFENSKANAFFFYFAASFIDRFVKMVTQLENWAVISINVNELRKW